MTRPLTITADHLRALLDTRDDASIIGMVDGEIRVIEAADREDDANAGALEVIAREGLVENLGDDPSEDELQTRAEELTTLTQQLGG